MGFRPGGNRAAWSHALHDKQQQQQQREKSRREQIWVFRQLDIPATSRGGGGRSGHHGVFGVARGETRGDVVRRVAEACLVGGSAWTCSALGAAAKAPVMKLPEDDSVKPLQQSGNGGSIPPFTVLPSGVQIADIAVGEGAVAESGKGVTLKWVMRRSNGYYVSSSTEGEGEPFVFRVGDEKRVIKGLDEGIRGMKTGGTRRIVVPPQLAYVEGCQDGKPGPIPLGLGPKQQINTRKTDPLSFEVKLTKVR